MNSIPDAIKQGMGIGSALTAYATREAKVSGASLAMLLLQSSEKGLGVYRKLGCQDEIVIGIILRK